MSTPIFHCCQNLEQAQKCADNIVFCILCRALNMFGNIKQSTHLESRILMDSNDILKIKLFDEFDELWQV